MKEMIYRCNKMKSKMPMIISGYPKRRFEDTDDLKRINSELKEKIHSIFGKSIAIREVDTGSDNSPEIELANLTTAYYDIEQYGITFVASPRHADVLVVTGPVTCSMANPLRKAYEATPFPKWVIALGDDACGIGLYKDSYATLGAVEKVIPVDVKIPGNPPKPIEIIRGLLQLIRKIEKIDHKA